MEYAARIPGLASILLIWSMNLTAEVIANVFGLT
jgi:hypothetical protein